MILPGTGRGTIALAMVEGRRDRDGTGERKKPSRYLGRIVEHRRGRYPHTSNALPSEVSVARFVALGSVAGIMRASIDLDGYPDSGAIKVQDIIADRMLASELKASRAHAQFLPEQHLRQTHLLPQTTRGVDC